MKKIVKIIAAIALTLGVSSAALLGGCFGTTGSTVVNINNSYYTMTDAQWDEYLQTLKENQPSTTYNQAVINRSLLSSVSILTNFQVTTTSYNPIFHTSQSSTSTVTYAGSGIIIDVDRQAGDMTVLTNCHVVYSNAANGDGYCDDITLYLYGGEYYDSCAITAEIMGTSKNFDLAVLKVTGSDVVKNSSAIAAEWCEDEEVYIGEQVYAVGNPEGEKMSVTMGIISKDSENITLDLSDTNVAETYSYRVLRTDAAINGGNSGGALYNMDGKIVGIVNGKSVSEEIDNMGYALPASTSRRVVQSILDGYSGKETHGIYRALIGITTTVESATAVPDPATGLVDLYETIVVNAVESNSKFGKSIQAGDVVTALKITDANGAVKEDLAITRSHNTPDAMLSVRAGDTVTLTVTRNGATQVFTATYSQSDLVLYE